MQKSSCIKVCFTSNAFPVSRSLIPSLFTAKRHSPVSIKLFVNILSFLFKLGNSEMDVSRELKLPRKQSTSDNPVSKKEEPLIIPGLPDELALECVLRVPVYEHVACKAVCKRWYLLFGRKESFFTQRKKFGFCSPWLFVFSYHQVTGDHEWKVLDLTNFSWHTIPDMPCKGRFIPHLRLNCVSFPRDGVLFVSSAMMLDPDRPLNLVVMKYELHRNRWTAMEKMVNGRFSFAIGAINGMIYVAGGNNMHSIEMNMNSAEVLDPKKGTWRPVANMKFGMTARDAAVLNEKLLVTEGWFWSSSPVLKGQVYDPVSNIWEDMAPGLRQEWTGSSVVVCGQLFVVKVHDRMMLKVYNSETDSWDTVDGPCIPEQILIPFRISSWDCKIYVVGRDLHIAVGHISSIKKETKSRFSVDWQMIDAPEMFSDLLPGSAQVLCG